MGLLHDLRRAGVTAQDIIQLIKKGKEGGGDTASLPTRIGAVTPEGLRGMTVLLVEVTGDAAGGGKYTGKMLLTPPGDGTGSGLLDLEAGVDDSSFGTFGQPGGGSDLDNNCYVFNAAEEGQATHDLTSGTPIVKHFIGVFIGYATDGKPVFAINGFDVEDCS